MTTIVGWMFIVTVISGSWHFIDDFFLHVYIVIYWQLFLAGYNAGVYVLCWISSLGNSFFMIENLELQTRF